MRTVAVVALVLAAACGGSTPPAENPSNDTASLENKGSSSSSEAPPASAPSAASDSPAAAPSSTASSDAPAASTAAAPPARSGPSVAGTIDGQAFSPKVAHVIGPMKKDGRIPIALTEGTDCPASGGKGDTTLTMLIPWQDGYKVDLSALKSTAKKGPAEISFTPGGKKASTSFKPSGTVTIVSAPMAKGSTGKLKIDLQSGDYMLAGDLDIQVCVAPK